MKIVCDTNVLVSGLIWGGTPGRVWDRIVTGEDRLCISRAMLTELARVLDYPRLAGVLRNRKLTSRDLLAAIIDVSDVVWPQPLRTPVVLDDPDDDAVLACAAAGASHIVTGDQHLLALGTWNTIRILTPADYLTKVCGRSVRLHEQ
jgi:putative PIN family toxin of toxin-antitoxin system